MKTMIYRAFSLMLFCLALVSCKDDFDIQKLQDHSRLVVYCFPTEGDTTLVSVAKSLPVASVKGNVDILSREKVDAHIIYKVNLFGTKEARRGMRDGGPADMPGEMREGSRSRGGGYGGGGNRRGGFGGF